jgi:hypothetical protein
MKRFVTRALIVVAAILGIVFAQVAPASANAPDDPSGKLASNLAALWTAVIETPASENPFIGNNLPACWDLGKRTIAQFGPITDPTLPKECTVKPGTKIFVVGSSFECSTFDNDCGRQDEDPPPGCDGTTADDLLRCARDMNDEDAPTITVDGKSVKVTPVEITMPDLVLPPDNLFGEPAGTTGLSAAHGWVTLLNPLTPGTHTIDIDSTIFGQSTTTIVVTPGN